MLGSRSAVLRDLIPNSATGSSPFMLVHGRELHSPVDLLYSGWVEQRAEKQNVSLGIEEVT